MKNIFLILVVSLSNAAYSFEEIRAFVKSKGCNHIEFYKKVNFLVDKKNDAGGIIGIKIHLIDGLYTDYGPSDENFDIVFTCWDGHKDLIVEGHQDLVLNARSGLVGDFSSKSINLGSLSDQQVIATTQFIEDNYDIKRWILQGEFNSHSKRVNSVIAAYLLENGVDEKDIDIHYISSTTRNWSRRVRDIKKFGSKGKKSAIFTTISGKDAASFYKELKNQGISTEDIPVLTFNFNKEISDNADNKTLQGIMYANFFIENNRLEHDSKSVEYWKKTYGNYRLNDIRIDSDFAAIFVGIEMIENFIDKSGFSYQTPSIDSMNLVDEKVTINSSGQLNQSVKIARFEGRRQWEILTTINDYSDLPNYQQISDCPKPKCPPSGACPQSILEKSKKCGCPDSGACPQ